MFIRQGWARAARPRAVVDCSVAMAWCFEDEAKTCMSKSKNSRPYAFRPNVFRFVRHGSILTPPS